MGIVLKAFDGPLNRTVAIKVLGPHLALNPVSRQRFAREAKAAATVVNLNVIAIHSVAEANGLPYFVMPYVRGPSLEKRLRDGNAFSVVEILRIGMQIASGLAAAHAQGVVHRDIKPANIMLEEGIERVTITDFGLARVADDASMTQSGVVAGTPQYMSPEQARGDAVDPRSDLFSLGSVLYALCTGQPPFQANSTMGVLKRVEECRPRPVRTINPEIPELLAKIIERLHAKDPAERFQSAAEVAVLLEGYLAHLGQPETMPVPVLAAAAREKKGNLIRHLVRWLPGFFALVAAGLGGASLFAGCGGTNANLNEGLSEFHHDFRGQTLPKELSMLNPQEGKFLVNEEPEGLRIKVIKPWIPPTQGVGVKTAFGLKGDFEATLTMEMLAGDAPPRGQSIGLALFLSPIKYTTYKEAAAIDRFVEKDTQGVRWWATDGTRKGSVPSSDQIVRLGLKRTGTILHYLWAPGMKGGELQEIGQAEWPKEIEFIRVIAFLGKTPVNVEVRLLDLRVRGNFTRKTVFAAPKGALSFYLFVGMVVTLVLALSVWIVVRRRRKKELNTDDSEQTEE